MCGYKLRDSAGLAFSRLGRSWQSDLGYVRVPLKGRSAASLNVRCPAGVLQACRRSENRQARVGKVKASASMARVSVHSPLDVHGSPRAKDAIEIPPHEGGSTTIKHLRLSGQERAIGHVP